MAGRAVLTHTLEAYARTPGIDGILTVIRPGDEALYEAAALGVNKLLPAVHGGGTRQQSVLNGLRALADKEPSLVLIHDAARPFTSQAVIERVIASLGEHKAAIAALPVADTLKRGGDSGLIAGTVDRTGLWAAQTPQAFHFADILAAHEAAAAEGHTHFSDDAAIAEWRGLSVGAGGGFGGELENHHGRGFCTRGTPLAGSTGATMETRTATGFDVHAFEPGDHVIAVRRANPAYARAERRIPTPTPRCTRSPTPCSAPSARATSATTSRRPIRNGAARSSGSSWRMRAIWWRRAAGASSMWT